MVAPASLPSVGAAAPLLSVRNLSVTLRRGTNRWRAVDQVGFSVRPGEALGLVGESGCGKTLTAMSLFRLLPNPPIEVQAESICLSGEELADASDARLAQLRGDKVGLVFQDPSTFLNPVLKVGDQIAEPLRFHRGLTALQARTRAIDVLREVGVPQPEERYDVYPHELSGGLRQRVLIAAALACDPQLLIADEPTTALDVTLQAQILALLDRERRARGMGMLFITHDLGVIAQVCERVAVMYAGRIVEMGETAKLFAHPRHPYTAGLLAAVRALDAGVAPGGKLPALRGMVPPLERFEPEGCRFRERCDAADGRCETTPALSETTGAACHHPLP